MDDDQRSRDLMRRLRLTAYIPSSLSMVAWVMTLIHMLRSWNEHPLLPYIYPVVLVSGFVFAASMWFYLYPFECGTRFDSARSRKLSLRVVQASAAIGLAGLLALMAIQITARG